MGDGHCAIVTARSSLRDRRRADQFRRLVQCNRAAAIQIVDVLAEMDRAVAGGPSREIGKMQVGHLLNQNMISYSSKNTDFHLFINNLLGIK